MPSSNVNHLEVRETLEVKSRMNCVNILLFSLSLVLTSASCRFQTVEYHLIFYIKNSDCSLCHFETHESQKGTPYVEESERETPTVTTIARTKRTTKEPTDT